MSSGESRAARRLSRADIPACLDLANARGWARERTKWELLLDAGTGYGVERDGRLVSCVVRVDYDRLAMIAMLLVAPDRGGRGVGRRTMECALSEAGSRPLLLYATELGEPLYQRLGFVEIDRLNRQIGRWRGAAPVDPRALRPATPDDLDTLASLDRVAFGADREHLLARLFEVASGAALLEDGSGYGMVWENAGLWMIGPVVARDERGARALIAHLAAGRPGPVRIDLPARFAGLVRWCAEHGLEVRPSVPAMTLHGRAVPGERGALYAVAAQAFG